MSIILKMLKGIAIGIANVIPGFSGGTMAVILKIYDEFVSSFADILHHPLKVIKRSWALFIGIVIGVVFGLFAIIKLLEYVPLPTVLFFTGLLLGSIPSIFKKVEVKPIKVSKIIPFILTFSLIIVLPLLTGRTIENIEVNVASIIIMFFMGIICASAMVIPGISGSMVLMVFGYYAFLTDSISSVVHSLTDSNISFFQNFLVVLFFGIGAVIGIVGVSKLIKLLYKKHENIFNICVFGLLIASPFAIIYSSNKSYSGMLLQTWYMWVIGIICLLLGTFVSYILSKSKKSESIEEN